MENLKNLIKSYGDIKKFLDTAGISRNFFYAWRKGQKRMSLQMATRIVKRTLGIVKYEDLANFEEKYFISKRKVKTSPEQNHPIPNQVQESEFDMD